MLLVLHHKTLACLPFRPFLALLCYFSLLLRLFGLFPFQSRLFSLLLLQLVLPFLRKLCFLLLPGLSLPLLPLLPLNFDSFFFFLSFSFPLGLAILFLLKAFSLLFLLSRAFLFSSFLGSLTTSPFLFSFLSILLLDFCLPGFGSGLFRSFFCGFGSFLLVLGEFLLPL